MTPDIIKQQPGRVVIKPLPDGEWYWHAYVGDERVNGGLNEDYLMAQVEAKRAIGLWRKRDWLEHYYYDVETAQWVKKGELPPDPVNLGNSALDYGT